jgi:hypothetical protein
MSHLTVIAADADIVAKPQFHAKPLFEEAKTKVGASFYTVPGHHFAFIAPFPKRVTDEEHIPIAIDPPSFNRMDFLKQVNGIVVKELGQK